MVTQENYWNSSGHFSAHDPSQRGKEKKTERREKCDVSAGFGVAAAAEKRWTDEKQAVLND